MPKKIVLILAAVIVLLSLAIGGLSFYKAAALQTELSNLQEDVQLVNNRIGVAELAPAKPVDVPNVVRDPQDVPPPITRTEPTTVQIELTVQEVVSELADGTTYSFWTFDGTVPGPLLRVMVEGVDAGEVEHHASALAEAVRAAVGAGVD